MKRTLLVLAFLLVPSILHAEDLLLTCQTKPFPDVPLKIEFFKGTRFVPEGFEPDRRVPDLVIRETWPDGTVHYATDDWSRWEDGSDLSLLYRGAGDIDYTFVRKGPGRWELDWSDLGGDDQDTDPIDCWKPKK